MKVGIYLINDVLTARNTKYPISTTSIVGITTTDPTSIIKAIATNNAVTSKLLIVNQPDALTSGIVSFSILS